MKELTSITFAGMRRIALGRLCISPIRFGLMLVGDFLDAFAGYMEGENERVKSNAELIRESTTILWNIQVGKDNKLTPSELWPFPWDPVVEGGKSEMISEEDVNRRQNAQDEYLKNKY